jgi:hypothetical protein
MKKIIISIIFFLYGILSAQIDLKIKFLNEKKSVMEITISNNTNDYYIVPFDQKGFKAYHSDEVCSNLSNLDYPYSFLSPTLMLKDSAGNSIEESSIRSYHVDVLNAKNSQKLKKIEQENKDRILKWKGKNNFSIKEDAIRNLYLYENLIALKPKEILNIKIDLDVYNIRRGNTYFYDYYILTNNRKYDLSINLCVDKEVYKYLTESQIKYFERYKLFSGQIESNVLPYIYKN